MNKSKLTVRLDPELYDQLRNTVAGMQQTQQWALTVSGAVEDAVRNWVTLMEEKHHDGEPWPPGQPRPGRPMSLDYSTE